MTYLIDLFAVIGAALIIAGVAMIYTPAALIVAGAFALSASIMAAMRAREPEQ